MGNSIVHLNFISFTVSVDYLIKILDLELNNLSYEEAERIFNKICLGYLKKLRNKEYYENFGFSDVLFQNPNVFFCVDKTEGKILVVSPNFKTVKNSLIISSLSIKSEHEEVAKKACAVFGLFLKRSAREWWEKEGMIEIASKIFN